MKEEVIHYKRFILTKGYEIACGIPVKSAKLFSFRPETTTCKKCIKNVNSKLKR